MILFPTSGKYFLTPHDRENRRNLNNLRDFMISIVEKRKQAIANKT
jgi:hypothetical protein